MIDVKNQGAKMYRQERGAPWAAKVSRGSEGAKLLRLLRDRINPRIVLVRRK